MNKQEIIKSDRVNSLYNSQLSNSQLQALAENNSTFNILALASGKANHKTPNWHCRAKNFRANECRAKLV